MGRGRGEEEGGGGGVGRWEEGKEVSSQTLGHRGGLESLCAKRTRRPLLRSPRTLLQQLDVGTAALQVLLVLDSVGNHQVLALVLELAIQGRRVGKEAGLVLGGGLDALVNAVLALGELEVTSL